MAIVGLFHQFAFYGLVTALFCIFNGRLTFSDLSSCAFSIMSFMDFFKCYLFWSCVLFLPISIIGAFETKYLDHGEGLTFKSDNILVIMFAHIAEEISGLVLAPFWFLRDFFTCKLNFMKIMDYIILVIQVIFIAIGLFNLYK